MPPVGGLLIHELAIEAGRLACREAGEERGERFSRKRTFVRRLRGTVDLDVKVAEVVLVGDGADAGNPMRGTLSVYNRFRLNAAAVGAYGSAMRRSVSLTIRFGKDMMCFSERFLRGCSSGYEKKVRSMRAHGCGVSR